MLALENGRRLLSLSLDMGRQCPPQPAVLLAQGIVPASLSAASARSVAASSWLRNWISSCFCCRRGSSSGGWLLPHVVAAAAFEGAATATAVHTTTLGATTFTVIVVVVRGGESG